MMHDLERRPVIAVFGSSIYTHLALEVGSSISGIGTLLTGGAGVGETVSNQAIIGAKDTGGRFIGVVRRGDDCTRRPSFRNEDGGLLLEFVVGHKRNYIEACLCDVAIAMEGGAGTMSEVICCLSLGRKVILVGNWAAWQMEKDRALNRLRDERCDNKVPWLDEQIANLEDIDLHERERLITQTEADQDAAALVAMAVAATSGRRAGAFPNALGPNYEPLKSAYHTYL